MTLNVLDLFAGCGGFSHGFQRAGCNILGCVEWWKPAVTTFLKNHPGSQCFCADITSIGSKELSELKGKVDIIVGGPPCQGFSICGKRNPKDKRNQLYKEFLRIVSIIRPKIVVIENVTGILSMKDYDQEKIINKIIHELIKLNYSVSYRILNAADYGVPQNRERVIIIAKKLDLFPKPFGKKKTVIEAIGDLPLRPNGLNGHVWFNTSPEILSKIKCLPQGGRLSKTFNFCRCRLYAYGQSKTIVTSPIYIHPFYHRFLTPRELARLQSFPDSFEFCGPKNDMVKQIGNAVPPLMAEAIAKQIIEVESK